MGRLKKAFMNIPPVWIFNKIRKRLVKKYKEMKMIFGIMRNSRGIAKLMMKDFGENKSLDKTKEDIFFIEGKEDEDKHRD